MSLNNLRCHGEQDANTVPAGKPTRKAVQERVHKLRKKKHEASLAKEEAGSGELPCSCCRFSHADTPFAADVEEPTGVTEAVLAEADKLLQNDYNFTPDDFQRLANFARARAAAEQEGEDEAPRPEGGVPIGAFIDPRAYLERVRREEAAMDMTRVTAEDREEVRNEVMERREAREEASVQAVSIDGQEGSPRQPCGIKHDAAL